MISRILLAALLIGLNVSCNTPPVTNSNSDTTQESGEAENFIPPAPGTIVATASMPVKDELNDFSFIVKVVANEHTRKGTYTIKASFGPNNGESMFTLPRGAAHLKPAVKKGTGYSFIVGFIYQDQFYDYYEVKAIQQGLQVSLSIKNIKAYTFQ